MWKTLVRLLPNNEIIDECREGAGLLMTRYYLTPKIFGCRLVIHQFHRSDNDRHYHDHPWNFISIILKGKYYEHFPISQIAPWGKTPINTKHYDVIGMHSRWDIIKRPKEWKHWVELPETLISVDSKNYYGSIKIFDECWTLVFLYGKRRDWGFHTEKGWVKHDKYDCRSYDE